MKKFLFIVLALSLPAKAEEVLKATKKLMAVSQPTEESWSINDRVCTLAGAKPQACGQIVKSTKKALYVKLDRSTASIHKGDIVERVLKSEISVGNHRVVNVSSGMQGSTAFIAPYIQIDFALSRNFVLGLKGNLTQAQQDSTQVSLLGGGLTLAYYFDRAYRGFFVQMLAGISSFTVTSDAGRESEMLITGTGLLGYQIDFGGVNLTLAAGAQYLMPSQNTLIETRFGSPAPMASVGLGFSI